MIRQHIDNPWTNTIVIQYPYFFFKVGTIKDEKNTKIAVTLPIILKSLDENLKTELKNKFTNGIVSPAPIEINIKGDMA